MENEQEAVNVPAEQTAPVESAPIETPAEDTSPTPVEESSQPKQVSETVPYSRFKEVNDRLKELESKVQPVVEEYTPTQGDSDNPFDEATTSGVMSLAEKAAEAAWERREAARWVKQNAEKLKNPIVDSRTKDLIRQGLDRDNALTQAEKELSEMVNPVQKEALAQGVKEGQELAQKKSEMGAIGTSGTSKIDPNTLSAAEFAKYHGIPRV